MFYLHLESSSASRKWKNSNVVFFADSVRKVRRDPTVTLKKIFLRILPDKTQNTSRKLWSCIKVGNGLLRLALCSYPDLARSKNSMESPSVRLFFFWYTFMSLDYNQSRDNDSLCSYPMERPCILQTRTFQLLWWKLYSVSHHTFCGRYWTPSRERRHGSTTPIEDDFQRQVSKTVGVCFHKRNCLLI